MAHWPPASHWSACHHGSPEWGDRALTCPCHTQGHGLSQLVLIAGWAGRSGLPQPFGLAHTTGHGALWSPTLCAGFNPFQIVLVSRIESKLLKSVEIHANVQKLQTIILITPFGYIYSENLTNLPFPNISFYKNQRNPILKKIITKIHACLNMETLHT
jgi:hypothetical protein